MTKLEALSKLHKIQRVMLAAQQHLEISQLKGKDEMIDPTVAAVISALDTATTAVATRIQAIIDNPPNSTADLIAALQPEVDKLNALGTQGTPAAVVENAKSV